ncbi:response regulator transcription factor [Paenibacillus sp. FSL H7-0357]|uniref:response regulator transcription factor n=1 Tax=Paenibacillus sp. FSL H7-0357 TaxID=1536774 RepID=UPI000AD204EE|nr:response regulator transcription factor [Paenibacillus sp. FSL H7-0357]
MVHSILIVEDEVKISRLLELELTYEGYHVEIAENGRDGLEKALAQGWNLIILDIMLPELNGVEVLRRLRKVDAYTPVILVTARNSTSEKVAGLDQGANDYITKPFEIEELLARIRANIRLGGEKSNSPQEPSIIQINNLIINKHTRDVIREGQKIELTPKEFDLLVFLTENKNQVLNREQIINHVWGYDFVGDTNVVDVYILYVRKKIDSGFKNKLIKTIRGIGYCIKEEDG